MQLCVISRTFFFSWRHLCRRCLWHIQGLHWQCGILLKKCIKNYFIIEMHFIQKFFTHYFFCNFPQHLSKYFFSFNRAFPHVQKFKIFYWSEIIHYESQTKLKFQTKIRKICQISNMLLCKIFLSYQAKNNFIHISRTLLKFHMQVLLHNIFKIFILV